MTPTEISKYLSYILRHQPEHIGLTLDAEGWADLQELILKSKQKGHIFNTDVLLESVESNDKKRFQISEDGTSIRAVQGHSSNSVNRTFPEKIPPEFLYHGTATRFLAQILQQGLTPQSRQYVHLSEHMDTATQVGQRYGKVQLLKINSLTMHFDGIQFFQAENGVWLVPHVAVKYIVVCNPL